MPLAKDELAGHGTLAKCDPNEPVFVRPMLMRDLHWLAGILEGEGSFGFRKIKSKNGNIYKDPIIQLGMTDEDIVKRAAAMFGSWCQSFSDNRPNRKLRWQTSATAGKAAAWMMTLYSLMGQRRRKRILEILTEWKSVRPKGQYKISNKEAETIRASDLSSRKAAKLFGLSQTQIRRIRDGVCFNNIGRSAKVFER